MPDQPSKRIWPDDADSKSYWAGWATEELREADQTLGLRERAHRTDPVIGFMWQSLRDELARREAEDA